MTSWAQAMLLWSWQSLLLICVTALLLQLTRPRSAAQRHRFWLLGLTVIILLPAANAVVTGWEVALTPLPPVASIVQLPSAVRLSIAPQPSPVPMENTSEVAAAPSWRALPYAVLFSMWLAGALVCLTRSLRSCWKSRHLRRAARQVVMSGIAVPIGYSREIDSPALVGILHPMILLPSRLSEWASDAEQRAVLLHELAHLERRDHLVNLMQSVVGALLFFHPAVRHALSQLVQERELACDERVLAAGASPAVYSEAILKAAEHSISARESYYPAFNASGKILERRIRMIRTNRLATERRGVAVAGSVSIVALALLLLPQRGLTARPQLAEPSPEVRTAATQPQTQTNSLAPATAASAPVSPIGVSPVLPAVVAPATPPPAVQTQVARISGTVIDQSGALVPGVTVTLRNPTTGGVEQTAVTNDTGAYAFPQVEAKRYVFEASLPGFTAYRRNVLVNPDAALVQDALLQVAGTSVNIAVSVAKPQTPPVTPGVLPTQAGRPAPPQRIGGDISGPTLVASTKPVYPPGAYARQVQGSVSLLGVVNIEGRLISLRIDPNQGTTELALIYSATEAVKQWQFRPALLNGMPVEFPLSVTVNFAMVE